LKRKHALVCRFGNDEICVLMRVLD